MSVSDQEIKQLIIDCLILEDMAAADIDSTAPLFGGGLGLDSIDVLDLVVAIEKHYGIKLSFDDVAKEKCFGSVRQLAQFLSKRV